MAEALEFVVDEEVFVVVPDAAYGVLGVECYLHSAHSVEEVGVVGKSVGRVDQFVVEHWVVTPAY